MSVRRPVSLRYPRLPHSVQAGTQFVLPVGDPVTGHVALFAVNDILRMKAFNGTAVLDNWMRVDVVTDPGGGADYFRYTCTLMSGTPGTFPKGAAIVNYGPATGGGGILLTSDAAMSPYIDVFTHAGDPWNSVTPRVRLGNLDGVLGLTQQWGIALGFDLTDVTAAARYIVASDQQVALHNIDLSLYNGANQSVELTRAGQLKIGTNISAAGTTELIFSPAAITYNGEAIAAGTLLLGDNTSGQPNVKVNDTDVRLRLGATTHVLLDTAGITVGEVGAGKSNIQITSGAINLRTNVTNKIVLDASGVITVGEVGAAKSNVQITAGEMKLRTNVTDKIVLDTSGNITLTGDLSMSTAGVIRAGATAVLAANGYWLDFNAGTPRFRIGTITGGALDEGIYWDGANIQIYSGTGSFGSPTTGLKIYTNATIGMFEAWGSGVKQVYLGTDGKLYAGAGIVLLDDGGISISVVASQSSVAAYKFLSGATVRSAIYGYETGLTNKQDIYVWPVASKDSNLSLSAEAPTTFQGSITFNAFSGATSLQVSIVADSNGVSGFNIGGSIRQSTALGARAYNSAAFTHNSTGSWLAVTLDSERFDNDGIHSTSSLTARLTCVTAGVYVITGSFDFAAHATGIRGIGIRHGGATFIATFLQNNLGASQGCTMSITTIYHLAAAEYVELVAYQNSGGNLNINASANYSPEFSMVRIA